MRSYALLGLAALAAASPAPQGFDSDFGALPTVAQGPPVGVGLPEETGVYDQSAALSSAEAAAVPTRAPGSKRDLTDLEKRTFCLFGKFGYCPKPSTTGKPVVTPTPTPAAPATTPAPGYPVNDVPSSCTPVDWVNTYAFTADPSCATAIEVGTFCGFINPDDPCAAQPKAYGVPTVPDTADAFLKNTVYSALALNAKTPSGYTQSFKNLQGSVEGSDYLSYKQLTSYDVGACAAFCDSEDLCTGFNIFIERDPAWNPWKCSCNNPNGVANYKCSIWGGAGVTAKAATNVGQYRENFQVVIAASNGYNKGSTPDTPPNTSNPKDCGGKLHNQQPYCIGQKTFPGPFDVSLCAAYAAKQNVVNVKFGLIAAIINFLNPYKCVQFQAAYIEKDGHGFGTHCRLFTKKFLPTQANLDISLGGKSSYSCRKSWTYDL